MDQVTLQSKVSRKQLAHSNRVDKVKNDFDRMISSGGFRKHTNAIKAKLNTKGAKEAMIASALVRLQKSAIEQNKEIVMVSISVLAKAFNTSERHVQRVITHLIKIKSLYLADYHVADEDGVVESYVINNAWGSQSVIRKKTNGLLRKIINPLARVKDYISTKAERATKAKEIVQAAWTMFQNFIEKAIKDFEMPRELVRQQPLSPNPKAEKDNLDWDNLLGKLGGNF